MVSFSSLPQELVDYIVELAAPPFTVHGWAKRVRTLKALCLTSKALLPPARRLLYRDVFVDNSSSLSALVSVSDDTVRAANARRTSLFIINRIPSRETSLSAGKEADLARAAVLLDRLQPETVALQGVIIDRCEHLQESVEPYLCFKTLTRLSIFASSLRIKPPIFTNTSFPNLVTLALAHTAQLPNEVEDDDDNYEFLSCVGERHTLFFVLPLLSSPSFRPRLRELHLIDFPIDKSSNSISKAWSEIHEWCAANGVRLFRSSPDDLNEPLDPSFWRFLDGVKARLGINV
ncbi:hypothetical protein JCM6882_008583 [Rhodosporidiobolus microsporus]